MQGGLKENKEGEERGGQRKKRRGVVIEENGNRERGEKAGKESEG